MSPASPPRRALRSALVALGLVGCLAITGGWLLRGSDAGTAGSQGYLTCQARRMPFIHDVQMRGEVESAVNVEVRCEVQSPQGWVRIIEVVPEGKHVKPGDFLVRLDASGLENDLNQQQILCEQSRAALSAARGASEQAQRAERAYLEGDYRIQHKAAEVAVMVAKNKQYQAAESCQASRRLYAQGFITQQQLQADEFALETADTGLRIASLKLTMLDNFSRPKALEQIKGMLLKTRSRLRAVQYQHERNEERLADIRTQIQRCTITAPVEGDVVLAHLQHNGHSHMIEPGEMTHKSRVLVRLPDPQHMQIVAKAEENQIAYIRPGLPVSIRFEAFEEQLSGEIVRVSEFPEPDDWMASGVKQYVTTVRIDGALEGLRPKLTADLTVRVRDSAGELQVPSQAVLKHQDRAYCIALAGRRLEPIEVQLGPGNGTNVVIRSGLEEGRTLLLAAAAHRDKVVLPGDKPPGKG